MTDATLQSVSTKSHITRRPRLRRWTAAIAWAYFVALLTVWAVLCLAGDRWWFPTLMLFGPRWVYGLPLVVLAPAALWLRWRLIWPLSASSLVVVGPIMGLCLPTGRLTAPDGESLRVLTCNTKGKSDGNETLNRLIREARPDLVALQGCWNDVVIDWPAGWHMCREAEFVVASRYPIKDFRKLTDQQPPHRWPKPLLLQCMVETPWGDVPFVSVHLPSPHQGISDVIDPTTVIRPSQGGKLAVQNNLRRVASQDARQYLQPFSEAIILAGDFNMPTDSPIYRECWSDFSNAFSTTGFGFGYTEWPTIRGFQFGTRIDHILSGPRWKPRQCWVGPDIGSDHLPLIADLSPR